MSARAAIAEPLTCSVKQAPMQQIALLLASLTLNSRVRDCSKKLMAFTDATVHLGALKVFGTPPRPLIRSFRVR